jgi:hypothetical protein
MELAGDGNLDLATAANGWVDILSGNGNGTFGYPGGIDVRRSLGGVVTGDFNRDGYLDLAVVGGSGGISFQRDPLDRVPQIHVGIPIWFGAVVEAVEAGPGNPAQLRHTLHRQSRSAFTSSLTFR